MAYLAPVLRTRAGAKAEGQVLQTVIFKLFCPATVRANHKAAIPTVWHSRIVSRRDCLPVTVRTAS
jgi:hypothetical protein